MSTDATNTKTKPASRKPSLMKRLSKSFSRSGSSLPHVGPLRIAVLGAGPGGIKAFQGLAKSLASHPSAVDLILVSDRDYYFNTVSTPRALVDPNGTPVTKLIYPLRQLLTDESKGSNLTKRVLVGRVESVGTDRRVKVIPSAERNTIEWIPSPLSGGDDGSFVVDYLVVALGSHTAFPSKVPVGGIESGKLVEQFTGAATKLADAKTQRVVVIGGGLVGIETAAEIKSAYPNKDVTIVAPELLPGYPAPFVKKARSVLTRKSITIIDHVRVNDAPALVAPINAPSFRPVFVPDFAVPLTSTDPAASAPASVPADAVFVATGVAPNSAPLNPSAWPVTDRGYLRVTPDLAVEGVPGVFAVGDIIEFPGKERVGKLAYLAGEQSKTAVANVVRAVHGESLKAWKVPPFTAVAALGRDAGIGFLPGIGTKLGVGAAVAKKLKGKDGGVALVDFLKESLSVPASA
ncbi:Apoptosis-inducing factor 2 [Allomyces arbusculus]|nr:Apoptosis-inducing factor 2 [Allomyces arbusculus]